MAESAKVNLRTIQRIENNESEPRGKTLNLVCEVLKFPEFKINVKELGEFTTAIEVFFWIDILSNKNLPDAYLGQNIRSKVITDVKNILDNNNIEMPSQVIEHKMYRQHKLTIKESNNSRQIKY